MNPTWYLILCKTGSLEEFTSVTDSHRMIPGVKRQDKQSSEQLEMVWHCTAPAETGSALIRRLPCEVAEGFSGRALTSLAVRGKLDWVVQHSGAEFFS